MQNIDSQTDESLVNAIRQDDTRAFKDLFKTYYAPLIRFCWYRVHCMETSRDLVQDLFTRVWLKRHTLDPNKSIKAYLYKALNNLIINHINLSSSKTIPFDEILEEKTQSNGSELESMIDMQKALDQMPPKLRTVFMLSRFEGYDYSEIAEICSISKKAVEKRMSRAFVILRKFFSENLS
jgi:RNA polymerase sigma-70 factor, ECF subfamily